MLSTQRLAGIAAFGGFFVIGSLQYFKYRITNNIRQSPYYIESFRIFKAHQG